MLPKLPDGTANETSLVVAAGRREVALEVVHDLRERRRAQLIEFTAPMRWRALNAASALTAFTTSWQSSNTPRTARLKMFGSCSEYICAVWNGLMRPVRREHEDADAAPAAHRVLGRRAGVAGRGAKDVQRLAAAREHVLEQAAEELHRDVLERERRAVRKAQQVQSGLERPERRDLVGAEDSRGVGPRRRSPSRSARGISSTKRAQDLERELADSERSPARRASRDDARIGLRHVSPPSGREPFQQDVGERWPAPCRRGC